MDQSRVSDEDLQASGSAHEGEGASPDRSGPVRTAVWLALSLGFVAYLAFGSVEARIWRFGQLQIESKSILQTWIVAGRNLPEVSSQWLLQALFYGAALVFIGCVILGMRLLLLEANDETSGVASDRS